MLKSPLAQMQITSPSFDEAEIAMLRECLTSHWVTQGPLTARFEKLVAERHSVKHALATTSCTAALHLSTLALGLGPGDDVIVPAFTWVTSAHAAEYVGARTVFADIDADTFNLDPEAFEAAITPNTRAVVVVHLFGLAADMDPIMSIARRHNLAVIEDAACAIASTYRGNPVGGIGDVGCFSFHPRKVVTTGEGGMVTTNRDDLALKVRSLRNHGASPPPDTNEPQGPWTMGAFNVLGFNLRLSDIQAAVGVAQMSKLEGLVTARRGAAAHYDELLADVPEVARPAAGGDGSIHTYQSYVIRVLAGGRDRRNSIMAYLSEEGIQTRPGTHAVHRLGYYAHKYAVRPDAFPIANQSEDCTITLPIFPGMSPDDRERVVREIKKALASQSRTR